MKHTKLILTLVFLFGLGQLSLKAQQGVVAAGGEATGSGGTMSFSSGQTDFMYFSSEAGSIQFGIQQVFPFDDDPDPDIPPIRHVTSDDLFQGEDQCFDATQTIVLAGGGETFIVDAETCVELIAGYNILMLKGTRVEQGGYLHARITSSDGPFCDLEEPMVASLDVHEPDHTADQEPLYAPDKVDADKTLFRVYPNPTTGDFTLEILSGPADSPYTIEVFGMRGEVIVRNNQLTGWQHHLSLQGHQPGLYMIRLQRGDEVGVERIIKR